ncbi:MAG: tyrosine-type recombinase/integrase [Candidatus Bathyarchaeia archaeon]
MMGARSLGRLSVCAVEIEEFCGDELVARFLAKYSVHAKRDYSRVLCLFFKWLKARGLELSPRELLNTHFRKLSSQDVLERQWASHLVADFLNSDLFEGKSSSYKALAFTAIKSLFNFYDAPLTLARNPLAIKVRRKHKPKQISLYEAKHVLGVLRQREKTICLIMLQSGMSIGDVLNKFNFMLDYVKREIAMGKERIRIDLEDRKGNGFSYFTFISRDAIHELKKWLMIRDQWAKKIGEKRVAKAIFIKKNGKTLTTKSFLEKLYHTLRHHKLKSGPFDVTSHMFRKLFKTESRPPERNIDQDCIEFMMGHKSSLDGVGGPYDRTPELYDKVIEREYAKLEPYINIFTGKQAQDDVKEQVWRLLTRPDVLKWLERKAKEDGIVVE